MKQDHTKGRGSSINPANPFQAHHYSKEIIEGIDDFGEEKINTTVLFEYPTRIINKVDSPDLNFEYSLNPYQGCEHGCSYCYARNSHSYWGFSAGLDFESKIIIKPNAPELLKKTLSGNWKVKPVMLSGNTDCYQPIEKKYELTRKLLEVFLKFRHPVALITKNSLILRDADVLQALARLKLVKVMISLSSLEESLRRVMEPRTTSVDKRLGVISDFSKAGIPVGIMVAPVIPGLNDHELPKLLKLAAENGARQASYSVVRLNGQVSEIFKSWLENNYPLKAEKIKNQISELHGGKLNDSSWGRRLKGEGKLAEYLEKMFLVCKKTYFDGRKMPDYDLTLFRRRGNLTLFDQ